MARALGATDRAAPDHQAWVHSRLLVERDFLEFVREGFRMIAAGFGSFAIVEGITTAHRVQELPRVFALAITAIGVIVILLAARHSRQMVDWVNADEYGAGPVPDLPGERRIDYLAAGAVVIGVISFIALLWLA
jgi:uncharacterized membrane protein YidH (DUF202 family)